MMRRALLGTGFFPVLVLAVVLILAGRLWAGADPAVDCAPGKLRLAGDFGHAEFTVELVDTPQARARGLMFVRSLPRSHGMLFAYPSERAVNFWMKNTLISLDMIFADGRGVVVDIHHQASPGDLTPIPSVLPVQYVLEVNGGLAKMLGITPGAKMAHPVIKDAALPCKE